MDNFWDLSTGDDALETGNTFETGGGKIEPIPDGTTAIALIDEAKWEADREGNQYISLRWSVLAPNEYKNRKIWQKLWVTDDKPNQKEPEKYRDKQKKMLAAIDANTGGKLAKARKHPTDEAMGMALTNKPMQIKVMVWDNEKGSTGNWVAAVAPRGNSQATIKRTEDDDAPF